jgi:RND superfamily putative drug exporter
LGSKERRHPLSLRRPRTVLGIALVLIVVLGYIGRDVESKLNPTSLDVPGTDSNKATKLLKQYFGDSAPFAILLQGPKAAIEEQGPALVHKLRASDSKVTTVSPWDKGKVGNLRPAPNKALVLVDFHVDVNHAVRYTVNELNEILAEQVKPPVKATQTGFATLSKAIQDESINASERSELIALPILLIVLLLVFRSPVAALIPLSFGAITVITSRGVLALLSSVISIDGFALTVSTMMGLALGVDYALLMVSRYREELAEGSNAYDAAAMTRRTAGRTTVFAGSTLFLAMVVSVPILPGALLVSLAGTMMVVVIISVTVATVVAPALLALLGPNVNRYRIGRGVATDRSAVMTFVDAALRRPRFAAFLIGGIVLILAGPVIGLKTGPPSTQQLPSSNRVRQDFNVVQEAIGPGYEAPFVVIAATEQGTMTERHRLDELARWQHKIAEDPAVQAVIGPEQVAKKTAPLKNTGNELRNSNKKGGELYELNRLGPGLARATKGVSQIRTGLAKAAEGAGLLSEGSGSAEQGALSIAGGLGEAIQGGARAVTGIEKLNKGSKKVSEGQGEAEVGAESVQSSSGQVAKNLRVNVRRRSNQLRHELNTLQAANPELKGAAEKANLLFLYVKELEKEAKSVREEAGKLHAGEIKLNNGNRHLHEGTEKLNKEAPALPEGLEELQNGTFRLANGISRLQGGSESLQTHLSAAGQAPYGRRQGDAGRRLADQEGQPDQHPVARPLRLRLLRALVDRRRSAG